MSKIDNQKAISHLQNKWASRACPMCGGGPWNIQDSTFQLTEYSEGNLVVGGPVVPVIPVTCVNCGFTALLNAILSGLIKPSAAPSKEDQN